MDAKNPLLLTPGPLTTSTRTKQAMQNDWGSRDGEFIKLTARLNRRLTALAQAEESRDSGEDRDDGIRYGVFSDHAAGSAQQGNDGIDDRGVGDDS